MEPQKKNQSQGELFERELEGLVRENHPLVKLSERIEWSRFEKKFGAHYDPGNGRPGISTRLMVGLTYLKYLHDASDEGVLEEWLENPYWQYFCGERYFQHEPPCERSSLSRWRKRMGEEGAEELFQESLAVAKSQGLLRMSDLSQLYVDTTVQEKNVCYPSEANLLNRARKKLVKEAKAQGLSLRQSYTRVGKRHQIKAHRYAAAKQWNRARRETKKLRTLLGRVIRDIERKATKEQRAYFQELIKLSRQLLNARSGAEKLYSLHEPATEAIAKGKMHKPFEYGVKVSVVTTRRGGFVLGCKAMHGKPYDGHTLRAALEDAGHRVGRVLCGKVGVDLGYRGHGVKERVRVFHPKLKRLSRAQRKFITQRSKVEATISLMKRCFRLGRNYLKGTLGDTLNALFAAAACNLSHVIRRTA